MATEGIVASLVDDDEVVNDIARFLHTKRHRSERTYFCTSDRTLAQELLVHFNEDRSWAIVEDDRS